LAGLAANAAGLTPKIPLAAMEVVPAVEAASVVAISPARLLSFVGYPRLFDTKVNPEDLASCNLKEFIDRVYYFYRLISNIPEHTNLFSLKVEKGGVYDHSDVVGTLFSVGRNGFFKGESGANGGNADLILKENKISSLGEAVKRIFPGRTSITPAEVKTLLRNELAAKLDKSIDQIVQEVRLFWDIKNDEYLIGYLQNIQRTCESLDMPEYEAKIGAEVERCKLIKQEEVQKRLSGQDARDREVSTAFIKAAIQGSIESEYNVFYFKLDSSLENFKFALEHKFENLGIDVSLLKEKVEIQEYIHGSDKGFAITVLDPNLLQKVLDIRNE
jgi:hypothetical protein